MSILPQNHHVVFPCPVCKGYPAPEGLPQDQWLTNDPPYCLPDPECHVCHGKAYDETDPRPFTMQLGDKYPVWVWVTIAVALLGMLTKVAQCTTSE